MNQADLKAFIDHLWDNEAVPTLSDYIRIPNKSPAFDRDWAKAGHMDRAVAMLETWARGKLKGLAGATLEAVRLPGRTPLIFMDIPATGKSGADSVLLYGHLDKQPEMTGWAEGTGPWQPVLKDGRLYGRGGADDGYAMFSALSAILALKEQGRERARCVVIIEASEESGSPDLPAYVDHLAPRIGTPSLVVCLDSGCGNYDQMWLTTSLRGNASGNLTVRVLTEGVHSGDASGIVPSAFRILRQLLDRIEDAATGEVKPVELQVQIPPERRTQAFDSAQLLGPDIYVKFPWADKTKPMSDSLAELVLNRTWRAQLAAIGAAGFPLPENAGNVLLPQNTIKLSLRLPPTLDATAATQVMKRILEADPPYGAHVSFSADRAMTGWDAPKLAPWLEACVLRASQAAFGKPAAYMGEGGSIPFMAMLGEKFPKTQFVVTGVLGPHSNAHGPNEFLDIFTAKRVSMAIAHILAGHYDNCAAK